MATNSPFRRKRDCKDDDIRRQPSSFTRLGWHCRHYLAQRRTAILLLLCMGLYCIVRWTRRLAPTSEVSSFEEVSKRHSGLRKAGVSQLPSSCQSPPLEHAPPIFQRYCNVKGVDGAEGRLPAALESDFELRSVVLTIRHGDRSNIETVSSSGYDGYFDCSAGDLEELWEALPQQFRILDASDGSPLPRALRPSVGPDGKECQRGQLTARGFEQHLRLGGHLRDAYRPLLDEITWAPEADNGSLYVRSTDYTRTITSAAAMLTAMLRPPVSVGEAAAGKQQRMLPIFVYPEAIDELEMMHGYGRRKGKNAGNGGESGFDRRQCPAIVRYAQLQKAAWSRPEPEYSQLRHIFGDEKYDREVCAYADSVYAVTCHGMPRPSGPGGCIEDPLANKLAHHADTYYCTRFAGSEGGLRATQLSMYPLMAELAERLQRAAALPRGKSSLAVYSGHDTVIAPILAVLGVYKGKYCRWPGYASRIAFELYARKGSTPPRHFVRIVFNGSPMFGVIGCQESQAELCPLDNFTSGVASLLGSEGTDFAAACREQSPPSSVPFM
eukprot:TRINITY_DN19226_c1_g1_i1.p1 TRINITY_DN19226_c1_g1~~TRINITY_DN19226_c1_g1_i1.p1  ORF type:complete len:553 (-),score=88.26 TRINITY_DN19226_c1_g1_i1:9-1667(-)